MTKTPQARHQVKPIAVSEPEAVIVKVQRGIVSSAGINAASIYLIYDKEKQHMREQVLGSEDLTVVGRGVLKCFCEAQWMPEVRAWRLIKRVADQGW